jgi:hypothetical protein
VEEYRHHAVIPKNISNWEAVGRELWDIIVWSFVVTGERSNRPHVIDSPR